MIYAWGGGVKAGTRLEGVSVFDVAPTILAALGYPVPQGERGMPGRVLTEMFEDGLPHETVATWFGERRRLELAAEAAADAEHSEAELSPEEQEELAKLHTLGYVSGDRNDPASTTLNLCARLLATRRFQRAIEEYEKLLRNPKQARSPRVLMSLARARLMYADVLRKRGDEKAADEQLAGVEEALVAAESGGANDAGVLQLRSRLERERGNLGNAELLARAAVEQEPLQAASHAELAEVLRLQMEKARSEGRHEDAEHYQHQAAESWRLQAEESDAPKSANFLSMDKTDLSKMALSVTWIRR